MAWSVWPVVGCFPATSVSDLPSFSLESLRLRVGVLGQKMAPLLGQVGGVFTLNLYTARFRRRVHTCSSG